AHPSAATVLAEVAAEIAKDPSVYAGAVSHRVGELAIGDIALAAAVATAHRAEAFAPCARPADEVKARLPVWKHQFFAAGTDEWVNAPYRRRLRHLVALQAEDDVLAVVVGVVVPVPELEALDVPADRRARGVAVELALGVLWDVGALSHEEHRERVLLGARGGARVGVILGAEVDDAVALTDGARVEGVDLVVDRTVRRQLGGRGRLARWV